MYLDANRPPSPQIKYGEFPFRLEYEINGQRVVVEDTLICQYTGLRWDMTGTHRTWKKYLSSDKNKDDIVLLKINEKTSICYGVGSAKFYMGDDGIANFPTYYYTKKPGGYSSGWVSENELLEKYGIKIISWEFSDPIVNTFK